MTTTLEPGTAVGTEGLQETPAQHHPHRWRLHRAGIVNVWHYYDEELSLSGGRLVLRGTNGSGKSRALELLLPFVLDADRRKMDATGSGRVRLEDLMRAGAAESGNRLGYVWLELARQRDLTDVADRAGRPSGAEVATGSGATSAPPGARWPGGSPGGEAAEVDDGREHLTVGALVRFSTSTTEARVWYFTTPLRVGRDLVLLGEDRQPLSREGLAEAVGADRVTDSPETHRERVRGTVFGLTGDVGRERYAGLLQLLHTLRSPDVGNRIDEGRLPSILSEALPPLSEVELDRAGEQLDGLEETRAAQRRLEADVAAVEAFLAVYRRYAAGVLAEAATAARATAETLREAERAAEDRRDEHTALVGQRGDADERVRELEGLLDELGATLAALKDSAAYRSAREIDERERRVGTLGDVARSRLDGARSARGSEAAAAADVEGRTGEVVDAARQAGEHLERVREQLRAAGLEVRGLPGVVHARTETPAAEAAGVRTRLEADPEALVRPVAPAVEVEPGDLSAAAQAARTTGGAARDRLHQASARHGDAVELGRRQQQVEAADRRAGEEDEHARAAADAATAEAQARDDDAVALAQGWRAWTSAASTTHALGEVDWTATAVHDVLLDLEALVGEGSDSGDGDGDGDGDGGGDDGSAAGAGTRAAARGPVGAAAGADADLAALDAAATTAAAPARDRLADRSAGLGAEQRADDERRTVLAEEAGALRAARDPAPPAPAWQTRAPGGSTPLWRLLDFTEDVGDDDARAGLEAALLASGLLTAALTSDGTLVAATGELLALGRGEPVARPVRAVLRPDTDDARLREHVDAVLARVGLGAGATGAEAPGAGGDGVGQVGTGQVGTGQGGTGQLGARDEGATRLPSGTADGDAGAAGGPDRPALWVDRDGSWGAGPLVGRHAVPASRHVGASARAAYRAQRLAEIAAELEALDLAADERSRRRAALEEDRRRLEDAVASAPRSTALVRGRARAAESLRSAEQQRRRAEDTRTRAAELRSTWLAASRDHRAKCERTGLPDDVAGLDAVVAAARLAQERCRALAGALDALGLTQGRRGRSAETLAERRAAREDAERLAELAHGEWSREATEVATLREAVGAEAAQVLTRIREAEGAQRHARGDLDRARPHLTRLSERASAAEVTAQTARERAGERRADLAGAADLLRRRLDSPALVASLPDLPLPVVGAEGDDVTAAAQQVLAALPARTADENALVRAQATLERDVLGNLDVAATLERGVRLVHLTDATGTRHVAAAAAELVRQRDAGRGALSDRERRVFTDFLLGGVAEELRRRIAQATRLVDAMNTSLGGIRTSHGIGVRLRWHLDEPAGSPTARLRDLVATSVDVRPAEETEELVGLIEGRVDEAFAAEPTAGYAAALRQALDYRSWHVVEVVITGPAPGQERRITRRAKLSQGETRFVSYVTLFAAADAYLSGLPDTARALRLVLLDDAFAKVDDRTIGELMGLLVRLDLDFVMTGHALWGCYPQVPSLDAYEVRRAPGTAAVTTHVHWDGRMRHLRAAR